jgi:dihydropteroate synthase
MGVLNCTPNSFSDGGELSTLEHFKARIKSFGEVEALDVGAESTAPMNSPIHWEEEWERLKMFLSELRYFPGVISIDTYHPETIQKFMQFYHDKGFQQELFWNDVSGKFDDLVHDFLKSSEKFSYVLCHNLVPTRALTGRHIDYVNKDLSIESLANFFLPHKHPRVIFDPCLGFSKTYEQNWMILERFQELQKIVGHPRWLLGFSRKSFLRKRFGLELSERDKLDEVHVNVLRSLKLSGEVWLRTHRPELV